MSLVRNRPSDDAVTLGLHLVDLTDGVPQEHFKRPQQLGLVLAQTLPQSLQVIVSVRAEMAIVKDKGHTWHFSP